MKVKQLSVFVENQPGRLAAVAKTMGQAGINILAMTIAETREFGVIRMIVQDWQQGMKVLHDAGFTVTTTEILAIEVADQPGALAQVMEAFAEHKLNIEYMYAFASRRGDKALIVFRFDNPDQAVAALKKTKIKVLMNEEVGKL
jgi:hypothetical protein